MGTHAILSPSSAHRWAVCPGSVALCRTLPDTTSEYAQLGTAEHRLHELILTEPYPLSHWSRQIVEGYTVDADMLQAVSASTDRVLQLRFGGGEMLVERSVPIDHITGEVDAEGTADVLILGATDLHVIDYKGGRGVQVDADENLQLMMYASGALRLFDLVGEITTVHLHIHQPHIGHFDSWTITVDELERRIGLLSSAAHRASQPDAVRVPGESQCKFCRAKADCPEASNRVQQVVAASFATMPTLSQAEMVAAYDDAMLGVKLSMVDWIESWCKAVRGEVERRLLAGTPVPGFKLVEGKKGNRAWTDKAVAEEALKNMRVKHDQMYDYSVISPTSAEKLAKSGALGPRQWEKLQPLITRADGKPSVAPESDKRPALIVQPVEDQFEAVADTADLC